LSAFIDNIYKKYFYTEERKRLIGNIFSLSVLQALNYLLPLITFPYQVRVLGTEKFGLLAFASSTIAYFNIIVDFGFNLTAPREIAIYREDKKKLSEIISSVMQIKFILFLISLLILLFFINSFDRFKQNAIIYYAHVVN